MKETKKQWTESVLKPSLRRSPERQEQFRTSSVNNIDTVYTPEDVVGLDYCRDLGYPGDYPYTRGIHPNMYRGRLWSMRQYAGFGTPQQTNKRFKWLLKQGQTGLSVAFDLPTQIGYDSDSPFSEDEVGRVGVAIDSIRDMEIMFAGIPLEDISTSMTVNATCSIILAMYIAVAKKQGANLAKLEGTTQNDILKEYIARNTYIFPPKPSIRLITDTAAYCSKNLPRWNYINIAGYHIREAGATAAQEIGFTFANATEYIEAFIASGLDIDFFAPRISFIFQVHNNFLEEVAKFRALRRLWARLLKEKFHAKDPRSTMFRTHVQTGGVTLTAQQPLNNITRASLQSLAAVLGGVQSIAVSCYDEGICIPTEQAQLQALRVQQLVAYESGVTDVADPLGGAYYIEYLTNKLEEEARHYMKKIESLGGAVAAIEQGYQQREIQEAAYMYQREIEDHKRVIVGINKFISPSPKIPMHKADTDIEAKQLKQLKELKRNRDNDRVAKMLKRVEEAARGNENTMTVFIECVESYATLGEICDVLRNVFGTQRELLTL